MDIVEGRLGGEFREPQETPPVQEPTGAKIQTLLQHYGVKVEEMVPVVRMSGEGPHSSTTSEHGHVKASRQLRGHKNTAEPQCAQGQ